MDSENWSGDSEELRKRFLRNQIHRSIALRIMEDINQIDCAPRELIPTDISTHEAFILGFYWQARSLHKSIAILLDADFPDEALLVARSLFIESLRLQELAVSEPRRAELVLAWANDSLQRRKKMLREANHVGLVDDFEAKMNALREEETRQQKYQRDQGVEKLRDFMDPRVAVKKFGRDEDYFAYELAHQMVHGSSVAHISRSKRLWGDVLGLFSIDAGVYATATVVVFAGRSTLLACRSACTIFGWREPPQVSELLAEVAELRVPS